MKKFLRGAVTPVLAMVMVFFISVNSYASSGVVNGNISGNITLPTESQAYKNGQVQRVLDGGREESKVKPRVFADVKLSSVRTHNEKLNYAQLALKRAIASFQDKNMHFKNNDFYVILNNGFIINKDNYNTDEVYQQAKKAFLDEESYQGDTIFSIGFLSGQNKVVKQNLWKLIDMVNLAPGSEFTSTTNYDVGITDKKQVVLGQTIGLKMTDNFGVNLGVEKTVKVGLSNALVSEINETMTNSFTHSNDVSIKSQQSITVKHTASTQGMTVLRYQLVDNINVDLDTFNTITKDLKTNMNMGGRDIVDIEPASGKKGIDIPTGIIFDVMVNK